MGANHINYGQINWDLRFRCLERALNKSGAYTFRSTQSGNTLVKGRASSGYTGRLGKMGLRNCTSGNHSLAYSRLTSEVSNDDPIQRQVPPEKLHAKQTSKIGAQTVVHVYLATRMTLRFVVVTRKASLTVSMLEDESDSTVQSLLEQGS